MLRISATVALVVDARAHAIGSASALYRVVTEVESVGPLASVLVHDAVALGELKQRRELLGVGVAFEVEREADRGEANRGVTFDAQRSAEIEGRLRHGCSRTSRRYQARWRPPAS